MLQTETTECVAEGLMAFPAHLAVIYLGLSDRMLS